MYDKKQIEILGHTMAYIEVGEGDPIVFLHGNPTSSYLWRNVIPHLESHGRCIAPDLIGMGDSDKIPGSEYRFAEHAAYLEAFLDALEVQDRVILVLHDWGSGLGFDWAERHRSAVKGIAYMESIVRPVTWEEWPETARPMFQAMRSPAGETIILDKNVFVEQILPASIMRPLTDEEMSEYRRPYLNPGEDRRPTLTWPREIPINGEPADMHQIVSRYSEWLSSSPVPKLFINTDPGIILTGPQREFCRKWPNQEEVTVKGLHFVQEDSPHEIGEAIARFVHRIG
ncbi:MAG: haloalkane dehalogenase [Gammaproteobacteria bacterium]|nr:haloalkane dehalogenase [Gammaproteobacteria bacterium]